VLYICLGKYITLFNKEVVKNLMMADIDRNMQFFVFVLLCYNNIILAIL